MFKKKKLGKQCHFDIVVSNVKIAKDNLDGISAWEFHNGKGNYLPLTDAAGCPGGLWENKNLPNGLIVFFEVDNVEKYLASHDLSVPDKQKGDSHPRSAGRAWAVIDGLNLGIYGIHEKPAPFKM
jgi:hypothetical protein